MFIAEPAPGWCSHGISTAVDDEHQAQNDGAQIELAQVRLERSLEEADAHTRDDDRCRGHQDTRYLQNLHEFACDENRTLARRIQFCVVERAQGDYSVSPSVLWLSSSLLS